ncbi:MAG: cobalt ECF transporter T component CbiQ [Anaerolineales bacterium]|jgi:cobalt/nickel transport system permease protein
MHANLFDSFQDGSSLIHKLDPRVKILGTIAVILSNTLLPDGAWLAFALTWLTILAINYFAGLSFRYLIKRSLIAIPFALAAVTVIFNLPGQVVSTYSIGRWTLVVTDQGLIRFTTILLRSWLSVQIAVILISTTQFPDIAHGMRHLKIPGILVSIIAFMYRYLYLLSDETIRVLRARDSRSARLPEKKSGGSLGWQARTAGNLAGQLFLRSYERSDRVYNAMLARGFQGELLTMRAHNMSAVDWTSLLLLFLLVLLVQFLGHLIWLV